MMNREVSKPKAILPMMLVAAILGILFFKSFFPDYVHFSNDGPLGAEHADWVKLPQALNGQWDDLNSIGFSGGMALPDISSLLFWLLGPIGYAKFLAPIALFILALGIWTFLRQLKLSPFAATMGALAAALNSMFFSGACWGTASQQIAYGMDFFALALIVSNSTGTRFLLSGTRLALAGLCVGINVMEAADIGALCSLCIAGFIFFKALMDANGAMYVRAARGLYRVMVVAIFASFIATQAITSLVGTQIQGVADTEQTVEAKAARWDFSTQWSLPKMETLSLFIPGVFGYRMDTPNNMIPIFQDHYQGGVYWGSMGRSPEIDRFLDSGGQGTMPPGFMRFSGSGAYCGILVWLIAAWGVAQSIRRKKSLFIEEQKKIIWFWALILIVSLPLAWGRFAPLSKNSTDFFFYALLYKLPYFSTIRNPAKFLIFLAWAVTVLFAYGIHALDRNYLVRSAKKVPYLFTQLSFWWKTSDTFDRRLIQVILGILGSGIIGWLTYSSQKNELINYLEKMGFPDVNFAQQIATFSINQVGWFLILFTVALGIFTLIIAGYFVGQRAKIGTLLLGGFLIFDLGRSNLPYIIYWNYQQKYEINSLNPIVRFLTQEPYEHRVVGLPFDTRQQLQGYDGWFDGSGLYRIEWTQHLFLYYNIQCLDIIQMPRMPEDLKAYLTALSPHGTPESLPLMARLWELTNTRYILGAAGFLDVINEQLDPAKHRFNILTRFDLIPKLGITHITQLEQLTAETNANGQLALFDFTGALPRVKLYSNWQVDTNSQATLDKLSDLKFDPHEIVLISTPEKDLPTVATNENTGTVEFKSYTPEHIVLAADAKTPSVLLLNDKYDPNWKVAVDGQPAKLLRCNYIMRGVYLHPGQHTVEFDFAPPKNPLYVTITAIATGMILVGLLVFLTRKQQTSAS